MNRRKFISIAGGIAGYSVMARVEGFAAAPVIPSRESISRQFDVIAPPQAEARKFAAEPNMRLVDLSCDVLVAGGGISGVCAAIAAARQMFEALVSQSSGGRLDDLKGTTVRAPLARLSTSWKAATSPLVPGGTPGYVNRPCWSVRMKS